jgi:uncharacterized repeat protein (TIGR03803 family)
MSDRFDEPAKGFGQAAKWRRAFARIGIGLACAGRITAWADWTPPESSVTPPAVVTLDAFASVNVNGDRPMAALVLGPDGALYGSTSQGGAKNGGTLFRVETNGTFTKLHEFDYANDGDSPTAALVAGPDSALYGSAQFGGTNGSGTLFRVDTNGTFTKLHDFKNADGFYVQTPLVVGPDGALYGSTQYGGANSNGTLFRLETDGTFTKLHDFKNADGYFVDAPLVVGPDGALYGSTENGGVGNGTLFRLETNGTFTKLHDFNGLDGATPNVALVVGPEGALYGSTSSGGTNGVGTLFQLETNGTFTKLHDFDYVNDGGHPGAALVLGPDGALYGSTYDGGPNWRIDYGYGTLFRLETNGTFSKLHDFNGADGHSVDAPLVVGPDGALYGSTHVGGTGYGTLFRLETNGTFAKLHDLNGPDGAYPATALVVGPDGALYGSTEFGGSGDGTVFRVETNGTFTKLYDFNATYGNQPSAPLVLGPDAALYGSTYYGGTYGAGTLFRVEAGGTFTKLHDFDGTNGAEPATALVLGPDGALYGSTPAGGTNGVGTLFRVEPNGTFTKLYDFGGTNGAEPAAALVVGPDGALYGSTQKRETSDEGTLFRLETNGTFTKLHDFSLINQGANPAAALVVGPDGALYGSTQKGGTNLQGTLFRLNTNGTFTKLHDFPYGNPSAPLVVGPDAALYGSTPGGPYLRGVGTLFRLETNGTFTELHVFNGGDGSEPGTALAVGPDGALYGSTQFGGTSGGYGTLFRLETDGAFTKLYDFDGTNGANPLVALVVGPDGAMYGSTQSGGAGSNPHGGNGTLFRVETNGTFARLYTFNGTNGARPSTALAVGSDGALYGSTPYGGPRAGGILFKLVLNRPPVPQCNDVTVSAGPDCVADASVDNGSFDPDTGDTTTLSQEPPGPYPLGSTPVTLTVTDNHGASASCTAMVTVMDMTPPTISDIAVTPNVLWPPNHKMVEVTVNYTATDDCSAVSNVLSVTSNEAPNGAGNGTAPDWVIEDSHHVQLRAERSDAGTGRVYTITVISSDNAGNSSTRTVTVTVPKSKK